MKSALNILMISLLGLFVSFCSSSPKEETAQNEEQNYDSYSSSGTYNDIESESRDVSGDYDDDDYGDAGTDEGDDEAFLSSTDSEEDDSEPATMDEGYQTASLPIEEDNTYAEEEPESQPAPAPMPKAKKRSWKKKKRKKASVSKFKNGMYTFDRACNMRSKASTKGRKLGKVSTTRKLWVEGHNSKWVKVQRKSGPAYVHRTCL